MSLKPFIEKCLARVDLSIDEASHALRCIMSGDATDVEIAGLLVALRAKGEHPDELIGFARTMRERAVSITIDDPCAIDMCGTGGDGLGTINVSTLASLVAAGAGVHVAKHGNRSVSSRSGSADVLSALGVNIQCPPSRTAACINDIGIGFLFAPLYHPAMKHAAPARTQLGIKSIFNLVGPLANPAGVRRQLVGTYQRETATKLAGALTALDVDRACIVHSIDGVDEVSLSADTDVVEVHGHAAARRYTVGPSSFGCGAHPLESIRGGTGDENAAIGLRVLEGERSPYRDVVVANAAMGIYVAGVAESPRAGAEHAVEAIDSGRALKKLRALVEATNRP
jgi:anthranilate phosphoribosyltransferase